MLKNHHVYRIYNKKRKVTITSFFVKVVFLTLIFYFLVTNLFISTYKINSISMEPTLKKEDRFIISPLNYGIIPLFGDLKINGFRKPEKGELVLVKSYHNQKPGIPLQILNFFIKFVTLNQYDLNSKVYNYYTMKRVIGVPGDTIKMNNFITYIKSASDEQFISEIDLFEGRYPLNNEIKLSSGDWQTDFPFMGNIDEIILGKDEYFLLGDNRISSNDSRSWRSPVNESRIIAKILFRYYPLNRIGIPK